jgi:hypothetical protein
MGETNSCYYIGLAHTDLIVQANNPSEALQEARSFRDDRRDILGYHPWAVPYLIPEDVNGYGRMAELGLVPAVRMIRSRESLQPGPPAPRLDKSLDTAKLNDARANVATSLAALIRLQITQSK